jgi:hypothetical protein
MITITEQNTDILNRKLQGGELFVVKDGIDFFYTIIELYGQHVLLNLNDLDFYDISASYKTIQDVVNDLNWKNMQYVGFAENIKDINITVDSLKEVYSSVK